MRHAEEVTFGTCALDRAAHLRATWEELRTDPAAKTVIVWRGKLLMNADTQTICRLPNDHPILNETGLGIAFLGLDGTAPLFATDISDWATDDLDEEAMGAFVDPTEQSHPTATGAVFREMRGILAQLSPEDAHIGATARGLFAWHQTHLFCARCGGRSAMADAGWRRDCVKCSASHFPRTDPVVIVLALAGNAVLMGRSPGWPEGMYSLLAGFVEPGETVEAAARREVREEAGIILGPVSYLASQPWPFPASLMFGMKAEALSTEITIDPQEIEDAKWVTREEMSRAIAGEDQNLMPARKGSIARFLIEAWLSDRLT